MLSSWRWLGKSWAIRTKAKLLAFNYPGIKILIVRRTYNELSENHIIPLCEELHVYDTDKKKRLAKYNDSKKHIVFPNGSRILFRYCENDKDAERFQGTEVDVLFIDEATHQTEDRVRKLTACVRGTGKYPRRIYYTFNPGGVGHAWVKRLFIDRKFKTGEVPEDYDFIQSLVTDNVALMAADPDYIRQLEALPPKLREAWLNGKWDIFEGQVFEEFRDLPEHYIDRRWSHVIQPFLVPEDWKIYRGFDWGYSKPFSVGWYAVDHENRIYRIAEFYGCTQTENEGVKYEPVKLADCIREIESMDPNLKGRKIIGIADPAIFSEEKGESIGETMARKGIYFDKADNSRIAGKMQCHYRFAFDENGIPMFYVFNTCKHFIRTIPMLLYDEKKVEDVDTSLEDHCLIGDTLVWTEHGRVPIRDLVGTSGRVLSSDGEFHQYEDVRLTQRNVEVYTVELEDGSTVTATANHRFRLKDGNWKRLDELAAGDELWSMSYSVSVQRITPAGRADVYNMEVEGTHDFAVESGIIVHNCYDEFRYVMMENPMNPPVKMKPVKDIRNDPLDLYKDTLFNTDYGKYDYIRF